MQKYFVKFLQGYPLNLNKFFQGSRPSRNVSSRSGSSRNVSNGSSISRNVSSRSRPSRNLNSYSRPCRNVSSHSWPSRNTLFLSKSSRNVISHSKHSKERRFPHETLQERQLAPIPGSPGKINWDPTLQELYLQL